MSTGLAGVVLAAGAGTRLRPLTLLRPKALCPVGGVPLAEHARSRLAAVVGDGPDRIAMNAHALAEQVLEWAGPRVRVSVEPGDEALGTAGGLAALREWRDGRDVLLTNADAYLPGGLQTLVEADGGWDGVRCRLLCTAVPGRGDFPGTPGHRYVGACLLPAAALSRLEPVPSGLYEVLWRSLDAAGSLDLVDLPAGGVAVDCGTPRDYLAANLHASGGRTVIGHGAVVEGTAQECVVWDGARVDAGEHLVRCVRAGTPQEPVTVPAW